MRTSRLFVEQPLREHSTLTLGDSSAHYLRNVLRVKVGQPIVLFNGEGGEYSAVIADVQRHTVQVQLATFDPVSRESHLTIKLGLGVTKRDAMDLAIRKATEMGATEIIPLLTDFTAAGGRSLDRKSGHWRAIVQSACEQCERNRLPGLSEVTEFHTWVPGVEADIKLIAHPGEAESLRNIADRPASVALLVGPEGGFSASEVDFARRHGFQHLPLGPRILRSDTAPVALLTLVQAWWGDLG